MLHSFPIHIVLIVAALSLVSCAVQDESSRPDQQQLPGYEKAISIQEYPAWREDGLDRSPAVTGLLQQADVLIREKDFKKAESKLERLLRISPDYAPAWSRMAWLALNTNAPKRATQMASRSNSFAKSNKSLQKLNWSFIREASEKMNDLEGVRRAIRKIESLEAVK